MSTDEPFKMPPSFDPAAIACSRRITDKTRPDFGAYEFDAEIRIYGVQYVIGSNFKTREDAQKYAESKKEEISVALMAVVTSITKGWKEAKA